MISAILASHARVAAADDVTTSFHIRLTHPFEELPFKRQPMNSLVIRCNFGWFQPRAAHVTCNVYDANRSSYNYIGIASSRKSMFTLTSGCAVPWLVQYIATGEVNCYNVWFRLRLRSLPRFAETVRQWYCNAAQRPLVWEDYVSVQRHNHRQLSNIYPSQYSLTFNYTIVVTWRLPSVYMVASYADSGTASNPESQSTPTYQACRLRTAV